MTSVFELMNENIKVIILPYSYSSYFKIFYKKIYDRFTKFNLKIEIKFISSENL
ncbi:Uncharacterised protein [Fluoribacter dumoffii]|uniref:Uncharacterized protein n=1 Tax=Fluoribacter dumoffii TaxID=463 RepID=A0A377IU60_9GAMM|nr:Uncharacterised protein [Fluoribacter dumoffii]